MRTHVLEEQTYGDMDVNSLDVVFVSLPFFWNESRTVSATPICHDMSG